MLYALRAISLYPVHTSNIACPLFHSGGFGHQPLLNCSNLIHIFSLLHISPSYTNLQLEFSGWCVFCSCQLAAIPSGYGPSVKAGCNPIMLPSEPKFQSQVEKQFNSESSEILHFDQVRLTGSWNPSIGSSLTNLFVYHHPLPNMSLPVVSVHYLPPSKNYDANASVLKHLVKLTSRNLVAWKSDLEIHLSTCGSGVFTISTILELTVDAGIGLWRMHYAQVLLAMRTTISSRNPNSILGPQHLFDAMYILSQRHEHGANGGLAVANTISSIVFERFDS